MREQLPGELLLETIYSGKAYDAKRVLGDVLAQLVALEAAGLYHSDVRLWNVIINPTGQASLIDYGVITKNKKDCVLPGNIFLVFIIFGRTAR